MLLHKIWSFEIESHWFGYVPW